jgi:hypothetical protein
MKQNTLRFLPLIIILFAVVGVLAYFAKNPKDVKEIKPETISPSNLESDSNLALSPTPTTSFFFSDEPATIPSTSEVEDKDTSSASDTVADGSSPEVGSVITTTTRICTPVYGMADTCTEHIVVDTGAESAVAYSLSAFSYLAGLVAFVKAKKA